MPTNFPTSLDTITNPSDSDTMTTRPHLEQHQDLNDAVEALEAKVGIDSSAVTTSLDYRVTTLETGSSAATGTEVDTGTDNTKKVTAKAIADSTVVYRTKTQTLTNKTLTSPTISGTWDFSSATVTLPSTTYPKCFISKAGGSTQTILTAGVADINFEAEVFDVGTMHDTSSNTSRITIPSGQDGYYLFTCQARLNAGGTKGRIIMTIKKNNSDVYTIYDDAPEIATTSNCIIHPTPVIMSLVATDYVTFNFQNYTGASVVITNTVDTFAHAVKLA